MLFSKLCFIVPSIAALTICILLETLAMIVFNFSVLNLAFAWDKKSWNSSSIAELGRLVGKDLMLAEMVVCELGTMFASMDLEKVINYYCYYPLRALLLRRYVERGTA